MDRTEKTILVVLLGVIGSCCVLAILCGGIFFLANRFLPKNIIPTIAPTEIPTETVMNTPNPGGRSDNELIIVAKETSKLLEDTIIPTADLNQLAEKFDGKKNIQTHLTSTPVDYQVGDSLDFYVLDTDTNETRKATATMQYKTESVYFWIENGVEFSKRDLKTFMDRFSSQIYPTDQEFFGKEWIPGVDNDPHLFIFYGGGLGSHVAGLTASTDAVLPVAHKYSNAHEMFYINSDIQTLSDPYTFSVSAHELQHLIHGYHDANEELWVNEGFSELATLLNGYDAGGFDALFSYDPDLQLNYWPGDPNESDPHYGASFLYMTYMLDKFGEEFTREVVADVDNGMVSIDKVFAQRGVKDNLTGEGMTANSLFADWAITNYLQDGSLLDGRYHYGNYPGAPKMNATETIYDCANASVNGDVFQYGTDYIAFNCNGSYDVTFGGQPVVGVLPLPADDHGKFWWSNRGDSSDIVLTHSFDFTSVSGPILMTFETWYDIETDYDYLYLLASTNGTDWQIVDTPSCTIEDPTGNSYGCGYNGQSNGWVTETVDLSQFAGKNVDLRFDYVTDGAVTGDGFALDNISIPVINYQSDLNAEDGGWLPAGFAWIENMLPQTFLVSLINTSDKLSPITKYQVAAGEKLIIDFSTNSNQGEAVLVISGSNRFTRQKADYNFTIVKK